MEEQDKLPASPGKITCGWTTLIGSAITAALAMFISTSIYQAKLKSMEEQLQLARRAVDQKSIEAAQNQLLEKAGTRERAEASTQPSSGPRLIELRGDGKGSGTAVRRGDRLQVSVFDLPAGEARRQYKVWLMTEHEQRIDAGLLPVDVNGQGMLQILSVPPQLSLIEVMDELSKTVLLTGTTR